MATRHADAPPDAELADATEALRQATQQHKRLLQEVSELQRQYRGGRNDDAKAAGVQQKLQAEVTRLASTLDDGQKLAEANTSRVRKHVSSLKSELSHLHGEVDRMVSSVARAEDSCRIATDEVQELREKLRVIRSARDETVVAMQGMMGRAREEIGTVKTELARMDSELGRLREQNDFLLLQQLSKSDA